MELELTQTLEALRAELSTAIQAASGDDIQFPVEGVQIELTVVAKRAVDAKGGVRFWVVEASSGASLAHEKTHRIVVTLGKPTDKSGVPIKVQRRSSDKP